MYNYIDILKKELICALGCTEPISIALASAKAREILGKLPTYVEINCSGNIIKNVKGVTVPNTDGMKGIEAAVAIGLIAGDSSRGLEVLENVGQEDILMAKSYLKEKRIRVLIKEKEENLYINVMAVDSNDNTVDVIIRNKHTNISLVRKNNQILKNETCFEESTDNFLLSELSLKGIFEFANTVKLDELKVLLDKQISYNGKISEEGLRGSWGAEIGKLLMDEDKSVRTRAKARAAAGSDARMSGCSLPVVVNSGSGNQGITCCLPILEYGDYLKSSKELIYRALIISNLTAIHIKRFIGRLSAFCGVTSAGVAAGAGIAYLDKQDFEFVKNSVANSLMIASGMICDGAKCSCAAKIATAVDAGITGYNMAKRNRNFCVGEGLLKQDVEETIKNIGFIAKEGMKETDLAVLHKMID